MLLPADHHVTKLVIKQEHEKDLHASAQATLSALRQFVWVINGRNRVKTEINKCVTCYRMRPTTPNYVMGSLPKNRISFKRPFFKTGVDFCGRFFIKEKRHRNRNKVKIYVAVFVCLATKAIRLEIVEDLTTEAFLACLRRFISLRGKPSDIYSDNATNFTGAKKAIDELHAFVSCKDRNVKI